jgi:hypothetical protein
MFRLIKLAAYAALGYVIYEFYKGITGEETGSSISASGRQLREALNENSGRMGVLTGEGIGQSVRSESSSGESMPHRVGRGVSI